MKAAGPKTYLSVQSKHNWDADRENNFVYLGLSEARHRRGSMTRAGDMIVTYITQPYCAFADIRRIVGTGLLRSEHNAQYDVPCSIGLATEPVLVLPSHNWIRIRSILNELELTRGKRFWGNVMRNSFRVLSEEDGSTLRKLLMKRSLDHAIQPGQTDLDHSRAAS